MSARGLVRGLAFLASLVAIGFLIQAMQLDSFLDKAWIDTEIRGRGLTGELLLVGIGAVFVAVGLPRQIISFLAGYGFGLAEGLAIALAATTIGCVITFFYARFMGRDLVARKFPGKIRRIDAFLADNPFTMTLLIRFLPAGSNLLTNLAAGVSSVSAVAFIAGSAFGYIPQTAIFALVGSGISVDPVWRIGLSIVLFLASGVLGIHLYRKYRHGKSLNGEAVAESH
ncbi:MAG: TVP38/TMEM64 family protein [Rhodospirillaceae bacterium]|jgi:uncharacterized membrane protein YdjX (TVP38/TMEM64 family)|nr:TVP38/TMEM64 family protein [Rhodospirillaceae bacterium]